MTLTISPSANGFVATGKALDGDDHFFEAKTLLELVGLLAAAGWHSTDITDAVDAAGFDWPGGTQQQGM